MDREGGSVEEREKKKINNISMCWRGEMEPIKIGASFSICFTLQDLADNFISSAVRLTFQLR